MKRRTRSVLIVVGLLVVLKVLSGAETPAAAPPAASVEGGRPLTATSSVYPSVPPKPQPTLSVVMLSYKAPLSLTASLKSFVDAGLLAHPAVAEVLVYFQVRQLSDDALVEDIRRTLIHRAPMVRLPRFRALGDHRNLPVALATFAALREVSTPLALYLECDRPILPIGSPDFARRAINTAIDFVSGGHADVFRLQLYDTPLLSRPSPGNTEPVWNLLPRATYGSNTTNLCAAAPELTQAQCRKMRIGKEGHVRHTAYCKHWRKYETAPHQQDLCDAFCFGDWATSATPRVVAARQSHPAKHAAVTPHAADGTLLRSSHGADVLCMSSAECNWTNQPTMYKVAWFNASIAAPCVRNPKRCVGQPGRRSAVLQEQFFVNSRTDWASKRYKRVNVGDGIVGGGAPMLLLGTGVVPGMDRPPRSGTPRATPTEADVIAGLTARIEEQQSEIDLLRRRVQGYGRPFSCDGLEGLTAPQRRAVDRHVQRCLEEHESDVDRRIAAALAHRLKRVTKDHIETTVRRELRRHLHYLCTDPRSPEHFDVAAVARARQDGPPASRQQHHQFDPNPVPAPLTVDPRRRPDGRLSHLLDQAVHRLDSLCRVQDDGFGILDLAAPAEAAQGVRDPLQPHAFGAVSRELSTLLDKHELRKGTLRESEDLVAALRALVLDNVQSVIARCEGEAAAELARRETKTLRNVAATGRGLVLPLESYGSALQAALTTTHGLLQKHLLNGRPILDLGGRGVSASRSARDLPGTSVPFVEAQTAARVAVVSRLLEQASRQLPPLKTALTAFNDLLPTIYSGFAEQAPHLPPVANLASHVSQLASLPLCVVELEGRRSDASQLAEEVSYVKSAMQSWAMQLWYQQLLAARRRTRFLDRLDRLQARQRATVTKRLAFAGWRLHVWQSSTARQFRSMRAELFSSVTHVAKKEALRSQCDESGLEATGVDDREATPWVTGEAAGIPLHPTPPQSSQHFSSPRRAIEEVGETVAEPDAWLSVAEITTLQSNAVRVVRQLDLVAEVCRSQLQQQRSQLDRLTKQNGALRSKCDELERKVLEMTKQHTAASNAAAAAEHRAEAAEARAARLASRVGLQEHHPWRDASVDGLRSLCQPFPCPHREIPTAGPIQAVGDGNEELAPPTAHVILRDWVNSCLDELHRLEKGDYLAHGLQGLHPETLPTQGSAAALAFAHAQRVRAANLDSDFRDGILLSRLVYYLALPKYEARAAVQESQTTGTLPAELRALLVKPGAAALSPPWPPYHGAFGDFTSLSFTQRALTTVRIAASVLQMSPAAPGVDAAQVADGHAPAIALLLGLLFHHCAHPFQHKTNADHAQEKPTPAGLQGIRPPLSSKEAHPHLVAGRFWPAVFLETSSDLKEFSTRVVQANESLRRYQWVVLRDVVASSAIAATRPSALGPRLLVATTEATAQRFVSAAIFSAAAVHIVSEVLGGAPKDAGTPTDDPDAPAVPDPDTTDAQEAVGLLSRYRRELVDLFLAHSVCSSDVPPGSPAATVGLPLKTWLDMCTATDVVPRYFGIDGATTLFVECNPSSAVLGPESEEERDALTNSHLLSLEEFLRLVIKAAGRLVRADRRTSMGSGVGSMCGSFVSLRGRGSVASDNSPSASLTVALQQLLAALLRLRHRGELDTFMDRFRGVTVQSVVGRYHADVAAVLGLYSTRAVNGTPAIDLQQFLRILRDASAITPEFSSAAAAELYTTVQTIPSVPSSSGVAAFIATDDHDAPDRQVSPARRRTLDGRRRSRSSSPAAPVPPEVKPADRPMHLPAFVLTLAIMACHRYPSPLQRLQEKLELFLTRGFLDTIRPKLSQLIKRRNQSVAGESARPR